nr:PREDICTED: uncharacterized protein LOC107075457 isoform X2 [Lepisosteus oculatus]
MSVSLPSVLRALTRGLEPQAAGARKRVYSPSSGAESRNIDEHLARSTYRRFPSSSGLQATGAVGRDASARPTCWTRWWGERAQLGRPQRAAPRLLQDPAMREPRRGLLLACILALGAAPAIGPVVFQYPRLVRVEEGGVAALACDVTGMSGGCYTVWWLQVRSGGALRPYPNKDGEARSRDGRGGAVCFLNITGAASSDSGTFYCAFSSGELVYFGNGSSLIVTGRPPAPLSMAVLAPPGPEPPPAAPALLLCLVFGADPERVRLYWRVSGRIEPGFTEPPAFPDRGKDGAPGSVKNLLTVPAQTWRSGVPITCVVETGSGSNMSKTVRAGKRRAVSARSTAQHGASQVEEAVQYASLQFEPRGRRK